MNDRQTAPTQTLGKLLRSARANKDLSIRDLAASSDIPRSTLLNLEQDKIASPKPQLLEALAAPLGIELAELYTAAGYVSAEAALPSFKPYLRSRYADLPDDARRELERSFAHIARKYGYDADGPAPGEDE